MNNVILLGRLTKDPELSYTSNNLEVCKFTVAVNRTYQSKSGEKQADFINCIAWRNTAKIVSSYFQKGSRILLEGSIQTGSYQDNSGRTVYTTHVNVETVEFVDAKGTNQQTNNSYQAPSEVQKNQEHFKQQESNNPFDNVGEFDVSNDDLPF